jgi:hypothetical protein
MKTLNGRMRLLSFHPYPKRTNRGQTVSSRKAYSKTVYARDIGASSMAIIALLSTIKPARTINTSFRLLEESADVISCKKGDSPLH